MTIDASSLQERPTPRLQDTGFLFSFSNIHANTANDNDPSTSAIMTIRENASTNPNP